MANSEHLEIVRGGVAAIAAWRAAHDERLDLRWADLGGADLGKANLSDADLCGANLYEADLRGADLYGANLYGANLGVADLREAYLCEADLYGANLREANLWEADLREVDLSGANLYEANLYGANLREVDLSGADLRGANLGEAYLGEAYLHGANLYGANLSGADLLGADLREALWDYTTIGTAPAPEGDLIGWGKKGGRLVKMLVPAAARRSCATTRKFRAEFVQVLEIEGGVQRVKHFSWHGAATYEVGQITRADEWDDDRWNECSHGIHFFLSRHEAERWA